MRDALGFLLVVSLGIILLFSDRGWMLSDKGRIVSHVADVPREGGPELANLPAFVFDAGVHVPRPRSKVEDAMLYLTTGSTSFGPIAPDRQKWPALGFAVREVSLLGMPLGYWREMGWSLYTQTSRETVALPLEEKGLALLREQTGRDLTDGFIYPFWRHLWGWLFLAGVAAWGVWRHRDQVRRREAEGLI